MSQELEDLRRALRESRKRLRRGAWESARQVFALHTEILRLRTLCSAYEHQIERYSSGVAIIELGQKLMRLSQNNERLKETAHRVWLLEKNLARAHQEYRKLSLERDQLAHALAIAQAGNTLSNHRK